MTPHAEVTLSVLDTYFRITSDDARMVELVRDLWRPFVVEEATATAGELHVGLLDEGWRVEAPPHPPIRSLDPWIVASTVRNAVSGQAIAGVRSIVPLHGAAVERDGVFLVLSGPVRAGKTTLVLALLERGWLLVTDDLVPVDPETLTATPFPKPLSVRAPARWRSVVHGWEVPGWMPDPAAVALVPATAVPSTAVSEYRPTLLVFPRYESGASPSMERLTAAQTTALCADNLHSRDPGEPGMLSAAARLGTSTPGYALRYGSTADALELLERCVADTQMME